MNFFEFSLTWASGVWHSKFRIFRLKLLFWWTFLSGWGFEQQRGQSGDNSYLRALIEGLSERLHRNIDTVRCHNKDTIRSHNVWFKDPVNVKLWSSHLWIIQLNFDNCSKMLDLLVDTNKYFWNFLGSFSFFKFLK